ncbi:MAG: thiamine biosynthesis protein ThiJ [Candidatus Dactylopiibacterium carminicum]|uniref:Thiamine biosynthesis protein ThiJ n=1 Tax=Candidatus Dactylopiibacterium carminicum TaxID=857335 RepID=A0A272EWE3_9RHOO|nr:DJ-1/PfpI family protein [Candidatus Dactylopiibacterium carminicum]KAF7599985.1 thiamine biosynthesis protein ThiJ [Candidatus Dactylopiibacterium carminicum]PAS94434.1 MAG: thiamine biosynthesis protein ThiJ [Candidatus Dactylopiibacterium carminicum]PAS96404.1 MAG: thiamine biosynthesis protein ThiJ [Candidatus Dactylopiibacterium carminicum]PAS99987.1 MAG: hypothetical protein BSR46_05230 [Candidatus Dactylopiibacterium carminicum]
MSVVCFYYPFFADFEITLAFHKIRQVGRREVLGMGYSAEPVTSESGLRYLPDITVAEALLREDIEALVIPGGPIQPPGEGILALIRQLHARGVPVAAICNGPHYLARAGLLDTRAYATTCTPASAARQGLADPFPRAHCQEEARVVCVDGLITAKGRAFVDFSMALFDALKIYPDRSEQLQLWRDIQGAPAPER